MCPANINVDSASRTFQLVVFEVKVDVDVNEVEALLTYVDAVDGDGGLLRSVSVVGFFVELDIDWPRPCSI